MPDTAAQQKMDHSRCNGGFQDCRMAASRTDMGLLQPYIITDLAVNNQSLPSSPWQRQQATLELVQQDTEGCDDLFGRLVIYGAGW